MIDRFVVGGFYRVHAARGKDENLNAPGAQFVPLAFESPCIPDLSGPAGLRAQPLLRVRRRRPARAARRGDRSRGARGRGGSRSRLSRRRGGGELRDDHARVLPADGALQPLDERAAVRARSRRSPTTSASATAARSSARCTARSTISCGATGCGSAASSTSRARRRRSAPTCSTTFATLARERETTDREMLDWAGNDDRVVARRARCATRARSTAARASCRAPSRRCTSSTTGRTTAASSRRC